MAITPICKEELEAARDAALECVDAANDIWVFINKTPNFAPEAAPRFNDKNIADLEAAEEKKLLRIFGAIRNFNVLPISVLEHIAAAAPHYPENAGGLCAHLAAMNLAEEFTATKFPLKFRGKCRQII